MAIAAVHENVKSSSTAVGGSSFTTGTMTTASATGNLMVAFCAGYQTSSTVPNVTTVTDTKSNTWSVISAGYTGGGTFATVAAVCYTIATAGLTTSDTVTVNFNETMLNFGIFIYEFSGVGSLNTSAKNTAGASSSSFCSVPVTPTTPSLVVALNALNGGGVNDSVTTTPTGYTTIDAFSSLSISSDWGGYLIQSSLATTDISSGVWNVTDAQMAVQAAFAPKGNATAEETSVVPLQAAQRGSSW